mmetsp:Transcript_20647/g.59976  ORF Transcript_20647/g.59976 Transcript_20647/m.59976 type:complete len:226 (-) Transcript_20647:243-920(-)
MRIDGTIRYVPQIHPSPSRIPASAAQRVPSGDALVRSVRGGRRIYILDGGYERRIFRGLIREYVLDIQRSQKDTCSHEAAMRMSREYGPHVLIQYRFLGRYRETLSGVNVNDGSQIRLLGQGQISIQPGYRRSNADGGGFVSGIIIQMHEMISSMFPAVRQAGRIVSYHLRGIEPRNMTAEHAPHVPYRSTGIAIGGSEPLIGIVSRTVVLGVIVISQRGKVRRR